MSFSVLNTSFLKNYLNELSNLFQAHERSRALNSFPIHDDDLLFNSSNWMMDEKNALTDGWWGEESRMKTCKSSSLLFPQNKIIFFATLLVSFNVIFLCPNYFFLQPYNLILQGWLYSFQAVGIYIPELIHRKTIYFNYITI